MLQRQVISSAAKLFTKDTVQVQNPVETLAKTSADRIKIHHLANQSRNLSTAPVSFKDAALKPKHSLAQYSISVVIYIASGGNENPRG
jgi:hypothetical protein